MQEFAGSLDKIYLWNEMNHSGTVGGIPVGQFVVRVQMWPVRVIWIISPGVLTIGSALHLCFVVPLLE